jgi:uncharacterized BrkB/YihY/UPF0761 family membrane protein
MTRSVTVWKPRYLKPLVLLGLTLVAYVAAINRDQAGDHPARPQDFIPGVITAALADIPFD